MKLFKPNFWDKNKISFFSILLFPISLIVKLIILFKKILTKTNKSPVPVICVGNIYLGGTGKTPLCAEIFSILKNINKNPAFIRKEYKSYQDEVAFQKKIGPTYQNKKRINAINNAVQNKNDIVILDDGFQDFSIKKDLSIICFNEKQWIGNGFTIPSGPLREGLSSLNRANFVIINGNKNIDIENRILKFNQSIKIFYSKYEPQNIDEFKNKKVISFAGIGNPNNFFDLLKKNDTDILEEIIFPDHYNYTSIELENLIKKSKANNAILITTEKDYLRIGQNYKDNIKYLKIKVQIENKINFVEELKKFI